MYFVYILKSETHQTHYYGSTQDIGARLKAHNAGKVRYTKGRRPWRLIYSEPCESRSEAVRREQFFKTIEGYDWLKRASII